MKLVGILLWLAMVAHGVKGAASSTNAAVDAFVATGPRGNLSGSNYGGGGSISVAAPGLAPGELQNVLQFNLAGAASSFNSRYGAGQWGLQSVTLQLTAAPANNAIFNTPAAGIFWNSWMQNDAWTEGNGSPSAPSVTVLLLAPCKARSLVRELSHPNPRDLRDKRNIPVHARQGTVGTTRPT